MDKTIEQIAEWKEKAGKWDVSKDELEKTAQKMKSLANELISLANDVFPDVSSLSPKKPYKSFAVRLEEAHEYVVSNGGVTKTDLRKHMRMNYNRIAKVWQGLADYPDIQILDNQAKFKNTTEIKFGKVSVMG